ncbi:MAG TPA: GAF domain-containing protein [Terriglobales bacterium]|nr:GAF domain-containing protein [Terriglobales bacterium]
MAEPVSILFPGDALPGASAHGRDLSLLAQEALARLDAAGIAIALHNGAAMVCDARAGKNAPELGTLVDIFSGITGRCVRENRALRVHDTESDPRVNRAACRTLGIRSLAVAPVHDGECLSGIIEAVSGEPGKFTDDSLRDLQGFAERVFGDDDEPMDGRTGSGAEPKLIIADFRRESSKPEAPAEESEVEKSAAIAMPDFEIALPEFEELRSSGLGWRWPVIVAAAILLITALVYVLGAIHRPWPQAMLKFFPPAPSRVSANTIGTPGLAASPAPSPATPSSAASTASAPAPTGVVKVEALSPSLKDIAERSVDGDAQAQVLLADHYVAGEGVTRDLVRAETWYVIASLGGNAKAKRISTEMTSKLRPFEIAQTRFNVAKMFQDGMGVSPDLVASYSWLVLAQAAGDPRAQSEEDKLAAVMKPEEIAQARERAHAWLSKPKTRH